MLKQFAFFKNRELPLWTPTLLAVLGAVLYLIQAIAYAYTTTPGLDEGSYLFKGFLFLNGIYEPFQPYGPYTNKAPFAFLIPGFAQYLFGAGLKTARFFSIFLGLSTLLAVWISARRWAGKWVAAAVVWVFALNALVVKIHAMVATEVIIAAMLAWICALALAEDRPLWQLLLASALAASAVLTRQNMIPLLPLLFLYILWQHGWKKSAWSLAVMALIFLVVHAYYWPRILTIWTPWLPKTLTPFLDSFRLPEDAVAIWNPDQDFWSRATAFFQGIRYHFVVTLGSIFALLFWQPKQNWKSEAGRRAAIFLAILYFTLFFLHAWAAVASKYEHYSCVYCFSNYLTFFDPLGILLLIIVFSHGANRQPSRLIQAAAVLLVLLVSTGIGLSLFESIGREILSLPVPRLREGRILPGSALLADLLANKFDLTLAVIKKYISSTLGFLAAFGILLLAYFMWRKNRADDSPAYGIIVANIFLAAGFVLLPILHARESRIECRADLLSASAQIGHYLDAVIPSGSLVYWDGGLSFSPMVYVTDARIFPPQINSAYTYVTGGDADTVYYFSHWNDELAEEWKNSADVFIIEGWRFFRWKKFLDPQKFAEYAPPPVSPSCAEGAEIRIFHRLP